MYGQYDQNQNYNQGYNQNQGYNNYNQQYDQQYDQQYQQPHNGAFKLSTEKELYCKCEGNGMFFAKKGSMVGYQGNFKFSKRLLGTNDGNIIGQVMNHLGRKITGENLEIMEIKGSGVCYLADLAQHVVVIDLEPSGPWAHLVVESEDLLAFTQPCHYSVTPVGTGVLSQKGLFMSKLSYQGQGAQVAIKTNGNPLVLQAPCRVDPDAVVAWTGANPHVKIDVGIKTLIGQTSGESYMFEFNEPGQFVIIQPYEREDSGLNVKIDGKHKPTTQHSSFGGGNSRPNHNGGDLGSMVGGIIGGLMK